MKRGLVLSLLLTLAYLSQAQTYTLNGVITDAETGEALIGAAVRVGNQGVVSDIDGNYLIKLEAGTHEVLFSYLGYDDQTRTVDLRANQTLNVKLGSNSVVLTEVQVVADIAIERETPVAFSNVSTRKIEEELAAQDIPMILNSTPGAYATQSGGGDGDARISIRGFNQRNVAVMLDGIPVNDMENGQVYWSNWFGLDLVTQTMQVQRGLGASKLSIPAIGGTINILTRGIDAKRSMRFRQEVGNNGFTRSTLGITSGRLENGWGISAAASYKRGNGWVGGAFTEGLFYYLRIDKQIGDHLFSLSGFGAPQQHGQRPFTAEIVQVDTAYAFDLGVPGSVLENRRADQTDKGRRYNEFWGRRDGDVFNTRKNYYHKPQISLRHSWQANERFFLSNIAYLSIGNGGGTAREGADFERLPDGQLDIDGAIEVNQTPSIFNPDGLSNTIIRASVNNHFWYGLLSTAQYKLDDSWTFSGGIDGRFYRGDHYREVYDLLGGNGFLTTGNRQIDPATILQEGDRFEFDYSGFVGWGGTFLLAEWKNDRWSAFANVSAAISTYRAEDFMKPRIVELADTSFLVSYGDTISYKDVNYHLNSPEAENQVVDWIDRPSITGKLGMSYKLDSRSNVFMNIGYISKAQRFNNVINVNRFQDEIQPFFNSPNERIQALELGYSYGSPAFSINFNAYYTVWQNKPLDNPPSVPLDASDPESDRIRVNIPGVDARHMGIEVDFAYRPIRQLTIEGLASIGDWIWNSAEIAEVNLPDRTFLYEFDAEGVHVGDAAQIQLGGIVRYEPVRGAYIKVRGTYFAKNYADFQPEGLNGENAGRESWQLPNYMDYSLHAGYTFKWLGTKMNARFNVLNLFDALYITDARNNDNFNSPAFGDFDAKSASVHFGQGRRWTMSLQISL